MSEYSADPMDESDTNSIDVSNLDDLNAHTLNISDTQLIRLLSKFGIEHGPILETTRTLYKRLLVRELKRQATSTKIAGAPKQQPQQQQSTTKEHPSGHVHRRDVEKLAGDYSDENDDVEDMDFDEESDDTTTYEDEDGDEDSASQTDDDDDDSADLYERIKPRPSRPGVPASQQQLKQQQQRRQQHQQQMQKNSSSSSVTKYYVLLALVAIAVAYYLASQIEDN